MIVWIIFEAPKAKNHSHRIFKQFIVSIAYYTNILCLKSYCSWCKLMSCWFTCYLNFSRNFDSHTISVGEFTCVFYCLLMSFQAYLLSFSNIFQARIQAHIMFLNQIVQARLGSILGSNLRQFNTTFSTPHRFNIVK